MKPILSLLVVCLVAGAVAGCATKPSCPLCYEDEWSRDPFPGEQKQHIKPITPDDLDKASSQPAENMPHSVYSPSDGPLGW
jgi:hypothetical protein